MDGGDEALVTDSMVYEFAPLTRREIAAYGAAEERFVAAHPDIVVTDVENEGDAMDGKQRRQPLSAREVFQWPEFKALANRLGIPDIAYETGVTIDLRVGQTAQFEVRAIATKVVE